MPAQQLDSGKSRGVISSLTNNPSSQALVRSTDDSYKEYEPNMKGSHVPVFIEGSSQESGINTPTRRTPNHVSRTQWITVAILTYVNLINYMDRYTIAGNVSPSNHEKVSQFHYLVQIQLKGKFNYAVVSAGVF